MLRKLFIKAYTEPVLSLKKNNRTFAKEKIVLQFKDSITHPTKQTKSTVDRQCNTKNNPNDTSYFFETM